MKVKGYTRSDGVKVKAHLRKTHSRQSTKNYKIGRIYRDKFHKNTKFEFLGKEGFTAKGHGVDKPDNWRVKKRGYRRGALQKAPKGY